MPTFPVALSTSHAKGNEPKIPPCYVSSPIVMSIDPGYHSRGLVTQRDIESIPRSRDLQLTKQIVFIGFAHGAVARSPTEC